MLGSYLLYHPMGLQYCCLPFLSSSFRQGMSESSARGGKTVGFKVLDRTTMLLGFNHYLDSIGLNCSHLPCISASLSPTPADCCRKYRGIGVSCIDPERQNGQGARPWWRRSRHPSTSPRNPVAVQTHGPRDLDAIIDQHRRGQPAECTHDPQSACNQGVHLSDPGDNARPRSSGPGPVPNTGS